MITRATNHSRHEAEIFSLRQKFGKALELGCTSEAVRLYDEILHQLVGERAPAGDGERELVVLCLFNKAVCLDELDLFAQSKETYEYLFTRFRALLDDNVAVKILINYECLNYFLREQTTLAVNIENLATREFKDVISFNFKARNSIYPEFAPFLAKYHTAREAALYVDSEGKRNYSLSRMPSFPPNDIPLKVLTAVGRREFKRYGILIPPILVPPGGAGGTETPVAIDLKDAKTSSANIGLSATLPTDRAAIIDTARLLIERASMEDRALIASIALPDHADVFEAIELAKQEFASRKRHFSKPPLPILSEKQLNAIRDRAASKPWNKRAKADARTCLEWVRDIYKPWVGKGLLQSHLTVDRPLYQTFAKAVERADLPDWLDVPNESDALMRRIADPNEQLRTLVARHIQRSRAQLIRNLG